MTHLVSFEVLTTTRGIVRRRLLVRKDQGLPDYCHNLLPSVCSQPGTSVVQIVWRRVRKAIGEHMQQETPNELVRLERHGLERRELSRGTGSCVCPARGPWLLTFAHALALSSDAARGSKSMSRSESKTGQYVRPPPHCGRGPLSPKSTCALTRHWALRMLDFWPDRATIP